MLKLITNDMFNISSRIKKIDSNLFVVYDTKKLSYDVYSVYFKKPKLAFCIGKKLNAYALKKAYITSCKNAKKIIKHINKTNKELKEKEDKELLSRHLETLNNYLNYADSKNIDVEF